MTTSEYLWVINGKDRGVVTLPPDKWGTHVTLHFVCYQCGREWATRMALQGTRHFWLSGHKCGTCKPPGPSVITPWCDYRWNVPRGVLEYEIEMASLDPDYYYLHC